MFKLKLKTLMFFLFSVLLILCIFYTEDNTRFVKKSDSFLKEYWAYDYLEIDLIREQNNLYGKDVKIGLIDTGVAKFIDVVDGINVRDQNEDYSDTHGHGTHIAGILKDDSFGIVPDSDLYIVKALDSKMSGDIKDIILGIEWLIEKEIDIILLPFGSTEYNSELEKVINDANEKGIFVVSSVGNYGLQEEIDVLYPAKFKNVLGVGALGKDGEVWKGSTLGEEVDILLPGQAIKSLSLSGDPLVSSGTSMASAYMAGILALYIEKTSKSSDYNIQDRILIFRDELNKYYKKGRYNLFNPAIILDE